MQIQNLDAGSEMIMSNSTFLIEVSQNEKSTSVINSPHQAQCEKSRRISQWSYITISSHSSFGFFISIVGKEEFC